MAIFNVINTNDSGSGSLRDAITQANTTAGADSIVFTGSVFSDTTPDTITLTSLLPIINDDLTITGTGTNLLTLSGDANGNATNDAGDVRLLFVNQGTVTLSSLTLTNGRGVGGNGGGNGGGGGGFSSNLFQPNVAFKDAKQIVLDEFEKQYLSALLDRNKGNITRSAQEAGLDALPSARAAQAATTSPPA
ncbi:MAG: hypothetical protein HC881_24550, partial [Leptolyngbyaceae cyanobacterium SL_7_1]|nr:hypothetical protein [Leptolyngbyaceae cyanobacterium SL_7_1]